MEVSEVVCDRREDNKKKKKVKERKKKERKKKERKKKARKKRVMGYLLVEIYIAKKAI